MATQICGSCFKSTNYTYDKAKFCSHCGADFSKPFAVASTPIKHKRAIVQDDADEEENVDSDRWKNMNLQVEAVFEREKGIKVKELSTGAGGSSDRAPETRNAEEVMAEFKKLSSTAGKPIEID
jgi:hypothetical protein